MIDKLKEKIKGKTVGVLSHGKSLYELQEKSSKFRDYDIVWTSFNYYSLFNQHVLRPQCKILDVVLECAASRSREFELYVRVPRMKEYIAMGATVLTTWRLMKTQYDDMEISKIYEFLFKQHVVLCDDLLGELNVPNSLALLIYSLAVCGPKRIILFGVDGYKQEQGDEFATYFMPEKQREYREDLLGGKLEYTLHETTTDFDSDFVRLLKHYCDRAKIKMPEIMNCSPGTHFTKVPAYTYKETLEELENDR